MSTQSKQRTPRSKTKSGRLIKILGDALGDAVSHLDYCGWGDPWERQGAERIEKPIRAALEEYRGAVND